MSIGHLPHLESLEICLDGLYRVLPQLRLLISQSNTRLPSLQTFTITPRFFPTSDQEDLFAFIPFQLHSCMLVPKEHKGDVLPFLLQGRYIGEEDTHTSIMTMSIAPSLRLFKMNFGGGNRMVVYPSSALVKVLWEVNEHRIVFSHSQGKSITLVG
jgi:hypothetical protein